MSNSNNVDARSNLNKTPKFTRGEKCIFVHLVVTFILILFIVIVYLVHLFVVNHSLHDVFLTRRSSSDKYLGDTNTPILGVAYFNITPSRVACNTILFQRRWSIARGQCVAARSEPDLAPLLFTWRIRFASHSDDTEIKRSIVHPYFDRDTLSNDIGLFQHSHPVGMQKDTLPIASLSDVRLHNPSGMVIGTWQNKEISGKDQGDNFKFYQIRTLTLDQCLNYTTFIMDLREYEFCVTLNEKSDVFIEFGAAVLADNKIVGIFSWGERDELVIPLVVLDVAYFQAWLMRIVS